MILTVSILWRGKAIYFAFVVLTSENSTPFLRANYQLRGAPPVFYGDIESFEFARLGYLMSKVPHRRESTDTAKSGTSLKRLKHRIRDFFFRMPPRSPPLPATLAVEEATPAVETTTRYDPIARSRSLFDSLIIAVTGPAGTSNRSCPQKSSVKSLNLPLDRVPSSQRSRSLASTVGGGKLPSAIRPYGPSLTSGKCLPHSSI